MYMDDTVVYSPSPCIRWLELGAGGLREDVKDKARAVKAGIVERNIGDAVMSTVSAAWGAGKAALAEIASRRGEATEYRLEADYFELGGILKSVRVAYADVTKIERMPKTRMRFLIRAGHDTHHISPVAWIESGSVRVPIGWERNGIEVPFVLIVEELAARCGLEIEG